MQEAHSIYTHTLSTLTLSVLGDHTDDIIQGIVKLDMY